MQTKQLATKKLHSYSNINQMYQGLLFVDEGFFSRKSKSSVFIDSISWNCILQMCCFLMCQEYLEQDSINILKQFLYFSTINFEKKVDVNYKSLNKINLVFQLKFGYFALYLEIYITVPTFLFHFSKINLEALYQLNA